MPLSPRVRSLGAFAVLVFAALWWMRYEFARRDGCDFAINRAAGAAVLMQRSVYDRSVAATISAATDPCALPPDADVFERFIGPPTTALLHVPFALVQYPWAIRSFRALLLALFLGSVLIASLGQGGGLRPTWQVGVLAVSLWYPVRTSLTLGRSTRSWRSGSPSRRGLRGASDGLSLEQRLWRQPC